MKPHLAELHAEGWYTVTGRATVAAIKGMAGFSPCDLMYRQVLIDGNLYFVWGVETHPVRNRRQFAIGRDFGLAVWEA